MTAYNLVLTSLLFEIAIERAASEFRDLPLPKVARVHRSRTRPELLEA